MSPSAVESVLTGASPQVSSTSVTELVTAMLIAKMYALLESVVVAARTHRRRLPPRYRVMHACVVAIICASQSSSVHAQRIDQLTGSVFRYRYQYDIDHSLFKCDVAAVTEASIVIHRPFDLSRETVDATISYRYFKKRWGSGCVDDDPPFKIDQIEFSINDLTFVYRSSTGSSGLTSFDGTFEIEDKGRVLRLRTTGSRELPFSRSGKHAKFLASNLQISGELLKSKRQKLDDKAAAEQKARDEQDAVATRQREAERAEQQRLAEIERQSKMLKEAENKRSIEAALAAPPDLVLSCKVLSIKNKQTTTRTDSSVERSSNMSQGVSSSGDDRSTSGSSGAASRSTDSRSESAQDNCSGLQGWQNLQMIIPVWTRISYCNAEPCQLTATTISAKEISVNRYTGQGETQCFIWQCERQADPELGRKF